MPKPRKFFIGTDEVLMVKCQHEDGQFFSETSFTSGNLVNPIDAWTANVSDDILQFVRFDSKTLSGEDVTEDVAQAWLVSHDSDLSFDDADEDTMPIFVKQSSVWADALEDGYIGMAA